MPPRTPFRQCPRCARHVRASERACPFCRTAVSLVAASLILGCGAATGLPPYEDGGDAAGDGAAIDAVASEDASVDANGFDVGGFDVTVRPDAGAPDARLFDGPVPPYGSPPRFDSGRTPEPEKDE